MSVKLTVVLSGRTVSRHEFPDDVERVLVGRNPECDLQIDNLGVSRHHCEIARVGEVLQVRDMKSGNGTFVNGAKILQPFNLNSGDTISLGKFSLRFESEVHTNGGDGDEAAGANGGAPLQQGLMTLQMDAASLAKKHRQQMTKNRGYLALAGGRNLVLEKPLCVFGRESDADVQLSGWFCPRVVALIIRDETGFRLVDVSPRGDAVVVNGIHKRDASLNDNDRLQVRGQDMTFRRGLPVGRA